MKSRGYRFGVAWIGENDEPNDLDPDTIDGYVSTLLLADLFGKDPKDVANDIVKYRMKQIALSN